MMIILGLVLSAMMMHPSRETVCELEWNETTSRVEASLRLSLADEKELLRFADRSKPPLNDFSDKATYALQAKLQFAETRALVHRVNEDEPTASKQVVHWLGRREEGIHVWWFFEVTPATLPNALKPNRPQWIRCHLLDDDSNQLGHAEHLPHDHCQSTFVLLGGKKRTSIVLSPGQSVGELPWE